MTGLPTRTGHRLGGARSFGFFVAPVTGLYVFRARFDDAGEVWLSNNTDPRYARRIIDGGPPTVPAFTDAAAASVVTSEAPGNRAVAPSAIMGGGRVDPMRLTVSFTWAGDVAEVPGPLFLSVVGSGEDENHVISEEKLLTKGGPIGLASEGRGTTGRVLTSEHLLSVDVQELRGLRLRFGVRSGGGPQYLATSSSAPKSVCAEGYSKSDSGKYCFKRVSTRKSWADAQKACRLDDASRVTDLAVMGSKVDAEFLTGRKWTGVWIGLNDISTEGSWRNVDGTKPEYTGWNRGEPNNANNEDCVHFHGTSTWNDLQCGSKQPFVCGHRLGGIAGFSPYQEEAGTTCIQGRIRVNLNGRDYLFGAPSSSSSSSSTGALAASASGAAGAKEDDQRICVDQNPFWVPAKHWPASEKLFSPAVEVDVLSVTEAETEPGTGTGGTAGTTRSGATETTVKTVTRRSAPLRMNKGETRYFEVISVNDGGIDEAIVSLQITAVNASDPYKWVNTKTHRTWVTSDVAGLSGEFFRAPTLEPAALSVRVNNLAAAASCPSNSSSGGSSGSGGNVNETGGSCRYVFSRAATPVVTDVSPVQGGTGAIVTINGYLFGASAESNTVDFGGVTPCAVFEASSTRLRCRLSNTSTTGVALTVNVHVSPLGLAEHRDATTGDVKSIANQFTFTVDGGLSLVEPSAGSVYGGTVLRITGRGFAAFGMHNDIMVGGVRCVPRTMKNHECRRSVADVGTECDKLIASIYTDDGEYTDIVERETAEWFDFSSRTRIECVLESTANNLPHPLSGTGKVDVTVRLLPAHIQADAATLEKELQEATRESHYERSDGCLRLSGCRLRAEDYQLLKVGGGVVDAKTDPVQTFGSAYDFTGGMAKGGTSITIQNAYEFTTAQTPTVTSVTPSTHVIPGSLVVVRGTTRDGERDRERGEERDCPYCVCPVHIHCTLFALMVLVFE